LFIKIFFIMPTTWHEATVVQLSDAAPNTRRFLLQVHQDEPFRFQPGQFVTLDLPTGDKRRDRWRSYSIANAPDETNMLELCIVQVDGGKASSFLFNQVSVGTTLRFKGPDGRFLLPDPTLPTARDLVFVCTGTGVAPFRSMLLHLLRTGSPYRNLHLVFGTRFADGILYREDFIRLAAELPGFRYSVTLSREQPPLPPLPITECRPGHVHACYRDRYAGPRPDTTFYLCGWSSMVDQATDILTKEMGYPPGQVRVELYG
jgi:CDP-4-dehydro-6-deoxyglucose reductase